MAEEYFKGKGQSEEKYTEQFSYPDWNGQKFLNPIAQVWWEEYPENLKEIVLSEFAEGNNIEAILRNHNRDLVLVSLGNVPQTKIIPTEDMVWHKTGKSGNYLYDGTSSTIEDVPSGCFITFEDPDYENDL